MSPFRDLARSPHDSGVDELERALRRSTARRRLLMGLGIALGVILVSLPFGRCAYDVAQHELEVRARRLDGDQRAELTRRADEAERGLAEREVAWRLATAPGALDRVAEGAAPCRARLSAPTATAADSYVRHGSMDSYFGNVHYVRIPRGAPVGAAPALASARATIADSRERTKRGLAETRDLNRVRALAEGSLDSENDVLVVVDDEVTATIGALLFDGDGYAPGRLAARAYVYDHRARAVVCAGTIHAENSSSVGLYYLKQPGTLGSRERGEAASAALARDLDVQIRRALANDLHAVASR